MLQVIEIKVRSLDLDHLDIFWKIANVGGPQRDTDRSIIYDYDFYVLRSVDSSEGPFEVIAGPFRDQYMMRDVKVSLIHKWRQYYYKIRVTNRATAATEDFGPVGNFSPGPDLIGAEIIRQEDKLFREHIGRRCWLLNRRTFGPLCSCYDLTLQKRTRSGHALCFDTGFLGGFMNPIEIWIQIDPQGKVSNSMPIGEIQPGDVGARMIAFPPVNPRDIIVETENRRWRVITVRETQRLRQTIHQELALHEIPRGDIEFDIPLNPGNLQDLEPAAPRNFTNPQNLENVQKLGDVTDILSFFGQGKGNLR
jgi:hypothetical protein